MQKKKGGWGCTGSRVVTGVVLLAIVLMCGVLYGSKDVVAEGMRTSLRSHTPSSAETVDKQRVIKNAPNEEKFTGLEQHTNKQEHAHKKDDKKSPEHTKESREQSELEAFLAEEGMEKLPGHALQGNTHAAVDKNGDKQKPAKSKKDKRKDKKDKNSKAATASGDPKKAQQKKDTHTHLHGKDPELHNYHALVSPRVGSAINTPEEQLKLLKCENQAKCVIPELQLVKKLRVYMCIHPTNHGVRFYFLVKEGLVLHPNVELMDSYDEALKSPDDGGAHYIVYLPGSSPWHRTECTNSTQANKLIVMDEFDGHTLFFPYKTADEVQAVYGDDMLWYDMYFKRSFVARRDGKFLSHPHLNKLDVYPLTYAISEAYLPQHFQMVRNLEIMCTLRGNARMQTRLRVQTWIQEYVDDPSKGVKTSIVGQINKATRSTVSKDYFDNMYDSQIIVTVNPSNWEGDFRLWESFATGALIFVDPIFVPHPYTMLDGVHCIFYHNSNKTELYEKLDYYRKNTDEARRIAIQGYLHALKYHRTVNLMDYVLRSAHLKSELIQKRDGNTSASVPDYTYTAQYLNHQTKEQASSILKRNLPADFKAVIGLHHDEHEPHALDTTVVMPSTWH
jgi:hypothetical protein